MANVPLKSIKFPGLSDTYTVPQIDSTLTAEGKAADAKAAGDKLTDLKSALQEIDGTEIEDYNAKGPQLVNVTSSATKVTGGFVNNASSNIFRTNASWNYYYLDAQPGDVFKVEGYQNGTIKSFYFMDSSDSILAYYPDTTVSSLTRVENTATAPAGTTKIYVNENEDKHDPSVIYKSSGSKYLHTTAYNVWKANISSVLDSDPAYVAVSDITEKTNYYVSGSVGSTLTENSHGDWRIMSMTVSAGQKYRVSANYYASIKGVFFTDADNKILQIDGDAESSALHTIDVTVPANAVKMSINDKKSSGFIVRIIIYPINNDKIIIGDSNIEDILGNAGVKVGALVGSNQYLVGTGKMKMHVNLFGSENGTVAFMGNLEYEGSEIKSVSDDVAPINTDAGYLGAKHGYNLVYDATLSGHGLTESDIGKTCTVDGNTWVLIKIKSANTFVVGCVDGNSVYGLKTVQTAPTTFNFGTSITVTGISLAQLRPSVKNINVAVTKNNAEAFEVSESYDIVTLGDGIAYIIDHVGDNTNDSVIGHSDPAITIRNLYSFTPNGACTIYQNCKMIRNDIVLNFCGGTQSEPFGNTDYFAVPMTSYDSLTATGADTKFLRNSTWDDVTKPPVIYCQTDDAAGSANYMMVQGILMDGRNAAIYDSAGFVYTSRKMYPYAVQPKTVQSADTTFDFISMRLPMHTGDMSEDFEFCQYCKVFDDYYFFSFSSGASSGSVPVPTEMAGRKIETIITKNAVCNNKLVVDAIDITATGESYLLLKLTK